MTLTLAQLQALVLGAPWQRLGDAGVSCSHWSTRCRPSCCVTACRTPTRRRWPCSGDPVLIDDDYFRSPRELGPGEFVTAAFADNKRPGIVRLDPVRSTIRPLDDDLAELDHRRDVGVVGDVAVAAPPRKPLRSTSVVRNPARAAATAAQTPATPPPITRTSVSILASKCIASMSLLRAF
jgi:hypothetical protein